MSKKAFDLSRNSIYVADPTTDLCIIGGHALPKEQRGPLDTEDGIEHILFDERLSQPLAEEFIANVDHYGVIEPVVITKMNDCAVVVAGRRRVRAARVANARRAKRGEPPITVECKMRKDDVMGVMLTENESREDDDLVSKIAKFRRYIARGVSIEHAARAFGVSASTAKGWVAFDDNATDATKDAVMSGKIAPSSAAEIARIKDPNQQDAALHHALSSAKVSPSGKVAKPSVTAARRAVKKAANVGKATGVVGKRETRVLLDAVAATSHPQAGPVTLAWWQGVEDALKFILGEDGIDARLTAIAEKAGL